MSDLQNNMPKNLPEDIGRAKNIVSMSESSGVRGDVSSKIGIGLDEHFESGSRRRHPKANALIKGLLIYFSLAFLIVGILIVVFWRLAEIREDGRAESFVENFIARNDDDSWRQLLRLNLPKTYPQYEDASKLAYDVLSPALSLGDITYLRRTSPSAEGYPVFELFSNGVPFASLVMKDSSVGLFSGGDWSVERVEFKIEYFDNVEFPEYRVLVPSGAELSVNGVVIDAAKKERRTVSYPALSFAEAGHDVAPCDIYIFNDVYFVPELSANLSGESLELGECGENAWFFRYPESATHSVKVTVPVGVDAFVGGVLLTESIASREEIDGELGGLDDGGTGTLPRLSVWTVSGIFGEIEVEAKIGENPVALLSSENGNYIFDTPAECKYTVTVLLPAGAQLFVNGKPISSSEKAEGGASAEDIAYGFTALGSYEVSELGVLAGAMPEFDKYILTGYLAQPNITAKLGEQELECAGVKVDGYAVRCEFDYGSGDAFAPERISDAEKFAQAYLSYICGGGAWNDPENEKAFKANYEALKMMMIEGTAGYVGVMESFREVNLMPKYDSFAFDQKTIASAIAYTDITLSCKIEFSITRTRTENGAPVSETLDGSISVLQVLYRGEWRVWSFVYETK